MASSGETRTPFGLPFGGFRDRFSEPIICHEHPSVGTFLQFIRTLETAVPPLHDIEREVDTFFAANFHAPDFNTSVLAREAVGKLGLPGQIELSSVLYWTGQPWQRERWFPEFISTIHRGQERIHNGRGAVYVAGLKERNIPVIFSQGGVLEVSEYVVWETARPRIED